MDIVVISLGGSLICPEELDIDFIGKFVKLIRDEKDKRFIIICGGGRICRKYQEAAKSLNKIKKDDLDWIGIMASRINAEIVRSVFSDEAYEFLVKDPYEEFETDKRIIIGAGYKPGSSTDLRAVQLADRFHAKTVINMSNITHVYSDDPKINPDAERLEHISWEDFRKMVGNQWTPGMNAPFDPIASKKAEEKGMNVVIIGKDLDNLRKVLDGEDFVGTTIA
jgi:uridylate kinase